MDHNILDLGSDVNVFRRVTWEMMGKPRLTQSPIQLRLSNQHKIIPTGRLACINVDIDGLCSITDFDVIEIVDANNPYHALLGLDWAFDNQEIVNLEKKQELFVFSLCYILRFNCKKTLTIWWSIGSEKRSCTENSREKL